MGIYAALIAAVGFQTIPVFAEDSLVALEKKSTKEWYHSLATQAASWGSPLVIMYTLRYNDALGPQAKAAPNTIWKMEDISTPALSKEAGYVTPNVNVIYGFGFMDLRAEPIVLEAPDSNNRYYMVEVVDMWTNAFAYIGGMATGYKGGKYLLASKDWKGATPAGMTRLDCPTPWVLLQPRVHIYDKGQIDLAGAKKVLEDINPTGLAKYLKQKPPAAQKYDYPAPVRISADQPVSALNYKDPLQFWEQLSVAMNENPPPQDQITALLPMFKPLGIEIGKPWDRSKLLPEVLEAMAEASKNISSQLAHIKFGTFYKGAFFPPPSIGDSGNDYLTRAIIARVGLTANVPKEAIYWMYPLDSKGDQLTGAKKYTMTFKGEIPYYEPGFWSITMYDATNNYTVPNPINRYMIGNDTKDLKKNADGSFTIYIQKDSPGADKESNWLPAPAGGFYLTPRAYAPKPEAINLLTDINSWPVPGVDPVP